MERIRANIRFQCPFGALVCGPSMSGKSTLMFDMLNDPDLVFDPVPQRVVYVYGAWQDAFDKYEKIEFVSSLDKVLEEDYFNSKLNNVLILDDMMEEIVNNPKASRLFTKYIHHKNISVFFLVQNLFRQGKAMRDIALNCQYIILFKSGRDVGQIQLLGRQLGLKHLVTAYDTAIKEPFGHILIDLNPRTPAALKLQSHIFSYRRIYLKK